MSRRSLFAALLVAGCGSAPDGPPQVRSEGGPVLENPTVAPVFFANDEQQAPIESFLDALAASSYWPRATAEYGVGPLSVAAAVVLDEWPPAAIDAAGIEAWLVARLAGAPPSRERVYALFYPPETTITYGEDGASCVGFGGFHGEARTADGASIVYVVLPRCGPPDAPMDALTGALSHELVEAVTNPLARTNPAFDGVDADHAVWNVRPLGEIGDLCADDPRSYQRLVGSYLVQRVWSNASALAGHDPCVPWLDESYFHAVPRLPDAVPLEYRGRRTITRGVRVPLGTSKTIEVQLSSDRPVGDWIVSAADATLGTGAPPQLAFAWDVQGGNDGAVLHVTITRLANGPYLGTEMSVFAQQGDVTNTWYGFVGN